MISAASLLRDISDYCSRTGMAETTFGRRAVNDGKFTSRLRDGGRVTLETVERVQHFIASNVDPAPAEEPPRRPPKPTRRRISASTTTAKNT